MGLSQQKIEEFLELASKVLNDSDGLQTIILEGKGIKTLIHKKDTKDVKLKDDES